MRHKKNLAVNDLEWDDTLASPYQYSNHSLHPQAMRPKHTHQHYQTVFSDDEDEPVPQRWTKSSTPSAVSLTPSNTATYVDPLLSSGTYHIHQAENALSTLKHVVLEDGWKKALKHKSGVVVHMMNGLHKADKTPIFKGEAIIHGFSPQSIFYVIGMRKLWDEQYEDGNLVENLNDTTSLTYEVTKPTATSKPRDFALVERIECTQSGSIIFAATSVETPRLPRIQGRTRAQIKLQGWMLEPIHGNGRTPSTRVTFVIQENMKGWVPGFAKKSLARRPLVIVLINDYLQKKSGRAKSQNKPSLVPLTQGHSRRPSLLGQLLDPFVLPQQRSSPSPTSSQRSILLAASNASSFSGKKRITFAEQDTTYPVEETIAAEVYPGTSHSNTLPVITPLGLPPAPPPHRHQLHHNQQQQQQQQQMFHLQQQQQHQQQQQKQKHLYTVNSNDMKLNEQATNSSTPLPTSVSLPETLSSRSPSVPSPSTLTSPQAMTLHPTTYSPSSSPSPSSQRLYPAHRHTSKKTEALATIKKLSTSPTGWLFVQEKGGVRYYSNADFLRADGVIYGGWSPEQLCSLTHCIGARKIWDDQFEHGNILERFSQKDYLVRWTVKNGGSYTVTSTIDTDTTLGTIYTASTSVDDTQVTSGSLRVQLYGWIFVPMKDDLGKRCVKTSMIWSAAGHFSQHSLPQLDHFLSSHGCPPYIRRVAGKVLHEELLMVDDCSNDDSDGSNSSSSSDSNNNTDGDDSGDDRKIRKMRKKPIYSVKYMVKHEPSNSYRARKSNPEKNWCTDIRVHTSSMFAFGFDVSISPASGTRVDITDSYIKIFTTSTEMEGKQVSATVVASQTGKVTCNGSLVFTIKDSPSQSGDMTYQDQAFEPVIEEASMEEELTDKKSSTHEASHHDVGDRTGSLTSKPTIINHHIERELHQHHDHPPSSPTSTTHTSVNGVQIPKGYVLVPQQQHQSNNIVIISDDLTFNGQQLAVVFVAMVLCYYMGKFACTC